VKVPIIILVFFALILAGCDSFELFDLLDEAGGAASGEEKPLSIVPVSATLEVGTEFTFSATGGIPPYVFSIVSGLGSIDRESGEYTAPAEASVDIVQVTDSEGSLSSARIVVVS
jgi:hypothetical protein